jgi:hypothetical protein
VPQPTQGTFVYRVKKLAAAGRSVAYSPSITVVVGQPFTVTAKAKAKTIKVGKKITISGRVAPRVSARKDRTVQLQVASGTTWKKVASTKTSASGRYSLTIKAKRKGTYEYRVVKTSAGGRPAASSPTVAITVKPR